jgi:sugar lactone lactonase YvrE
MTLVAGDVTVALDAACELGEGPIWDPVGSCLYFVDILRGNIHRFDPARSSSRTYHVDRMVGAAALTDAGDLMLAVDDGFARLDLASGRLTMVASVEADRPDLRMNDGACDAAGRFWAGTMALDERPGAGTLYRLDPDGRVHPMVREVGISNGLDWSDDGRVMYFIDSLAQSVDRLDFDLATGSIHDRRPLVHIPPGQGAPDGMTVDAEGCLWVALWGGGAVHRYTAGGALDRIVRLPTAYPTSCTFGGAELADLYITTAAVKLSVRERAAQPGAGSLFCCRPGPRGRAPHRFKG